MRFLLALLLASSALASESAAFAAQREKMTNRQRRIIYNSDGGEMFAADAGTVKGFYAQRMDWTVGTQVDSVFYCTGATVMFTHLAQVGETYGDRGEDDLWCRNVQEHKKAGRDVLKLVIAHGHKNEKEVFFTHRINDIHDSFRGAEYELATWKLEHPQFLITDRAQQHKYNSGHTRFFWSAFDFEHKEVRDYLLAIVEDVCSRYDIDGYEVDYFRSPFFFKPNLDRKPVSAKHVAILTEFQRKVREIAFRAGNKRGRPILVAVRVPMTVQKCRHVGIDIKHWLADNLFDLMTTGGGYVPSSMPSGEMVKLGHQFGKPVYPTISASGMRRRFNSIEAWRGAAANVWASGADGIVLFNTTPKTPNHPHFTELGDPNLLRFKDKIFGIDDVKMMEADLEQGIAQDQALPIALQRTAKAMLPIGDDIAAAAKAGRIEDVTLNVRFRGLAVGESVKLRINGRKAKTTGPATGMTVPGRIGRAVRFDGLNRLHAGAGESMQITTGDFTFSFWVKTRQKAAWSGFLRFNEVSNHVPAIKLYFHNGVPTISLRTVDKTGDWTTGGSDTLLDNQWHHFAATFDRDGDAVVYVDGQAVGTHDISDRTASLGFKKEMVIGHGDWNFMGLMDDLRLYNRALSAAEVGQIRDNPKPGELLAWWKFDEEQGAEFADASGNNHTVRVVGEGASSAWITYKPNPASLKQGPNQLIFHCDIPRELVIANVDLHVEYKDEP